MNAQQPNLPKPNLPSRERRAVRLPGIALAAACLLASALGCQSAQPPVAWSFDNTRAALDYYPGGTCNCDGEDASSMRRAADEEPLADSRVEGALEYASLPFAVFPVLADLIVLPVTGSHDALVFGLDALQERNARN